MKIQVLTSFNSLQTGKWIQRMKRTLSILTTLTLFQFPSNGKVDSKVVKEVRIGEWTEFQFPSNGKVDSKLGAAL